MIEGVALHELVYEAGAAVDYIVLDVNPAFERQTAVTAESVLGRRASEAYGTGEAPYLAEYARVAESGEPYSFESYFEPLGRHFQITAIALEGARFATIFEDVTERKQATQALRASEERSRLLHDTMVQGVVYQEADGTIVSMNPAAERILGKRPEDFLGSSSVVVEHDTLREDGSPFPGLEHPAMVALRTREAGSRRTHAGLQPARGPVSPDQHPGRSALPPRARRRPTRSTRCSMTSPRADGRSRPFCESEERLNLALSAGGIAAWTTASTPVTSSGTRSTTCMMGYEPGEVESSYEAFLARVHPDDAPQVDALFLDSLKRAGDYNAEFRALLPGGEIRWIVATGGIDLDAAGDPLRSYGVMFDVTERHAAEVALRKSEERFRLVLASAPVTVAAQDTDLRYVWAFGHRTAPPGGLIGKTDADIFTPQEADHLREVKQRVLDEGVEFRERLWLDRPQGRYFLDTTNTPLRDEKGAVVGVGVSTVDLTQMKLTEDALMRHARCWTSRTTPSSCGDSEARSNRGTAARRSSTASHRRKLWAASVTTCSPPSTSARGS